MSRMSCHFMGWVLVACLSLLIPRTAAALDIFKDTVPQAQTNTCQSYSMVLAIALLGDPAMRIETFQELRAAEARFRDILIRNGSPYVHDNWIKSVEEYTGGSYTLRIETRSDIVGWMARVKELTTQTSTTDVLISQLTGKRFPVVLTSVTEFAGSAFASGHVITVLGIAGSGIDSSTQIVAFNSAIKGQNTVNRCEPGQQPGDQRYAAGVISSNDYRLKDFSGFRILRIVRK